MNIRQLRKQKCTAGIREMLHRGDWPTKPPLGYDAVRINSQRRIIVNSQGKILKQAFQWKAIEGLSNEAIRVRLRFLHCAGCGRPMRGYLATKKKTHYYKCSTVGCANNKNADVLNSRFERILNAFRFNRPLKMLTWIKEQMVATFNQITKDNDETHERLIRQSNELVKKMNRLEERYIEEEMTGDMYNKYSEKYTLEKREIEQSILKSTKQVSNLAECINSAIEFAIELPLKWVSADYYTKQRIQYLLFPKGMIYDKKTDECRTSKINFLFLYLFDLQFDRS